MPATTELKRTVRIRETVDGIPVEQLAQETRASRSKTPKENAAAAPAVRSGDKYIWGIYIFLLLISLIELFSASSFEVTSSNVYAPLIRHAIFLAAGLGIVLAFQRMHYVVFRKWARAFALLSLVLLIAVSFAGVTINGAERALNIFGFTIQPPEIAKLAIVLVLAQILATTQRPRGVSMGGIIGVASVVLCFCGLTFMNGLTNTILLMAVSLCMFLIGGMEFKKFLIVLGVYAVAASMVFFIKEISTADDFRDDTQTEQTAAIGRSETWGARIKRHMAGVKPEDPITDENRQTMMAHFAQAHGGIYGQGPGNSRESSRLPLAFSDYIYSIVVEDTGFIGGACLLLLFLCLIMRAGRIASKCSRAFPALLIMGCAVLIVAQAIVHMAIVVGVAPVSGQPLPFISKGGTSILTMSAAIGMMLSVSRYGMTDGNKKQLRAELNELPEDLQAENPTFVGSQTL